VAWLRLWRTDHVGPVTFRQLINHFGSAEAALDALPDMAARGGLSRKQTIPSRSEIEGELARLDKMGARLVAMGEPDFPVMLRRTEDSPPIVSFIGDPSVFQLPGVSVVGSRNASLAGVRFTRKLSGEIGAEGYSIVSGLARGIDTAAHEASLGTGTIAALAGGLDHPYPPENLELFKAIPDRGGAVITEMPLGWEPRARDFPRRNRIIAALGLGLLVVEAAQRSGSLISARLANELGRIVFAVPGSPLGRHRESPAKAEDDQQVSGPGYKVLASFGHVRDLPAKDGSVRARQRFRHDLGSRYRRLQAAVRHRQGGEGGRRPDPRNRPGSRRRGHFLARARSPAPEEGAQGQAGQARRLQRHHQEGRARRDGASARDRQPLVDAYLARRALDYLVGFTLSPVLWRKLPGARSAGRVQSVALRLVCDREARSSASCARNTGRSRALTKTPRGELRGKARWRFDGKKLTSSTSPTATPSRRIKSMLEGASFKVDFRSRPSRPSATPARPSPPRRCSRPPRRKLGFRLPHHADRAEAL
jgi:DNA protecting protein DprA